MRSDPRRFVDAFVRASALTFVLLACFGVGLARSPAQPAAARTRGGSGHRARCAGASLTPSRGNIAKIDEATLCLVNLQRERHGEHALRDKADLDRAALGHSRSMVKADYFGHTSPEGVTLLARIRACGYLRRAYSYELGENLSVATLWLATPAATVDAWMHSKTHRTNILGRDFVDSGIGVVAAAPAQYAAGEPGATYTQDFGVVQVRHPRAAAHGSAGLQDRRALRLAAGVT